MASLMAVTGVARGGESERNGEREGETPNLVRFRDRIRDRIEDGLRIKTAAPA